MDRVISTTWATRTILDSELDEIAKTLGLDPDLLLEARAEAKVTRQERGLRVTKWYEGTSETRRYYQFHLFMPELVMKAWREECVFRQVAGPLLLRSLIHDYLVRTREPNPLRKWYWRGQFYTMGDSDERTRFLERATIPLGSRRALVARAIRVGTTPTALCRALAIEALSGLHRDVPLIEASMMFDDEERYLALFNDGLTRGDASG